MLVTYQYRLVVMPEWLSGLWNYIYVRFLTFLAFCFKIQNKQDFLRFLTCCTRFLEHCGPSDATATPSSLASLKSRLVSPFWCQLTQVVLEKRPLNGCLGLYHSKSRCITQWLEQCTQIWLRTFKPAVIHIKVRPPASRNTYSFARTSLGTGHKVATSENDRNRPFLYGSRLIVACL